MHTSRQQSGAVLFVALIMLLLLTMLSVSAMNSTVLQERMTANSHEYALAFSAAEAGMRDGEIWLSDPSLTDQPLIDASCATNSPPCPAWVTPTSGLWDTSKTGAAYYRDLNASWWTSNGIPYGNKISIYNPNTRSLPPAALPPRYLVEFIGFNDPTGNLGMSSGYTATYEYYYDVTGRGTARGTFAAIIVQSVFGRIF